MLFIHERTCLASSFEAELFSVDKIFEKIFSRADVSLQKSTIAHFHSQISEK